MQKNNREAAKFTTTACPQNSPVSSVNSTSNFTTAPATPISLEGDNKSSHPSPSPKAHKPRQRTPCPKSPVLHRDDDELFLPPPPAPIPDLPELDTTGPCGQIPPIPDLPELETGPYGQIAPIPDLPELDTTGPYGQIPPIPDLPELDAGQMPGCTSRRMRKYSWSSTSSRLDWSLSPNYIHIPTTTTDDDSANEEEESSRPVKRNLDDDLKEGRGRMGYGPFSSRPQVAFAEAAWLDLVHPETETARPPCFSSEAHIHWWLSMSPQYPYCPGCGEDLRAYLS